jgi:hypothetical protein
MGELSRVKVNPWKKFRSVRTNYYTCVNFWDSFFARQYSMNLSTNRPQELLQEVGKK